MSFGLPDEYYHNFAAEIEAVSLEDVRRVAKEYIVNEHLKILVAGDRNVIESRLREIGLPVCIVDPEGNNISKNGDTET